MCEWQTLKVITIRQTLAVDACIAEELELLNAHGVRTINSCCNHGEGPAFFNVLPHDTQSRALAEALGYEVRVKDDNGAVFLISRGIGWGQGGCNPRPTEVPDE